MYLLMQGVHGDSAAGIPEQTAPQEPATLSCRAPTNQASLQGMERQGSCPVEGSSPTSIASGPMSARSHTSVNGALLKPIHLPSHFITNMSHALRQIVDDC